LQTEFLSAQDTSTEVRGIPPGAELNPSSPPLAGLLADTTKEQAQLLALNERLQRYIRSVLDLRHKGTGGDDNQLGTADARYASLRQRLIEHRAMLAATDKHYDTAIDELRSVLQGRLTKTTSIQQVREPALVSLIVLCLTRESYTLSMLIKGRRVCELPKIKKFGEG
jgi:hypothetical protein